MEIPNAMVVVRFERKSQMDRAWEGGPWTFMGDFVRMRKWFAGCEPATMNFDKMQIWLQVHRLPIELMNEDVVKGVAAVAGKVARCDSQEADILKYRFFRAKVEINVTQPLTTGCFLECVNKAPRWLAFKYERLTKYCQGCGRLGHGVNTCDIEMKDESYGIGLRAETLVIMGPDGKEITDADDGGGAELDVLTLGNADTAVGGPVCEDNYPGHVGQMKISEIIKPPAAEEITKRSATVDFSDAPNLSEKQKRGDALQRDKEKVGSVTKEIPARSAIVDFSNAPNLSERQTRDVALQRDKEGIGSEYGRKDKKLKRYVRRLDLSNSSKDKTLADEHSNGPVPGMLFLGPTTQHADQPLSLIKTQRQKRKTYSGRKIGGEIDDDDGMVAAMDCASSEGTLGDFVSARAVTKFSRMN